MAEVFGRFSVFTRTDGKHVVYDPERPCGDRTAAGPFDHKSEAIEAAQALSKAADAAGEPNTLPRKGFLHDWDSPKTWERFA